MPNTAETSSRIKGKRSLGLAAKRLLVSLPEQFSVEGVEQKPKHSGLDREWEMRKQARMATH